MRGQFQRYALFVIVLLAGMTGRGILVPSALAADLPRDEAPRYAPRPAPRDPYYVYPAPPPPASTVLGPPASDQGYYGYYGFDLFGTPYDGLYSANVLCLRSIRTAYGYRTVNVCSQNR